MVSFGSQLGVNLIMTETRDVHEHGGRGGLTPEPSSEIPYVDCGIRAGMHATHAAIARTYSILLSEK